MAVRVLEAIGLEVKKEKELPTEIIEGIEQGWQELREGKGIPSEEVHKKADYYVEKNNLVSKSSRGVYFNFRILDRT